jgi:branched-chain amino acid transport system substrate-binding protein
MLKLFAVAVVTALEMSTANVWAANCGTNSPDDVPGLNKAAGTLTLGTIQPITGRAALIGVSVAQGIDIAIKEINAKGGVAGCKLEMVTLDNQYSLDSTVSSARRLVDRERVWAIVAPTGSAYLPAIYDTLKDSGTPMWGPISPGDNNVRQVYLLAPSRIEQSRVCLDYFADKGAKKIAALSQNNDVGVQADSAMNIQSKIRGFKIVANEKIDVQAPNLSTATLNIVNSGAEALLISLDPGSLSTALNGLRSSGFNGPICSDGGSAGVGGLTNVGAANPTASNGFLATLQTALPISEDPFVLNWRKQFDSYSGKFKDSAPGFSFQGYAYVMALARLIERLNGDLSRNNFHKVAESLVAKPISLGVIPEIACGPLPGGHTCAKGAGLARFDGTKRSWSQIQSFRSPKE